MPGLLKAKQGSEQALAFKEMSGRSHALLNRIVLPSAATLIYAAIQAHSHPGDWLNPTSLLSLAATVVTFTLPYSYFSISNATKSLTAAGKAVEIDAEKQMGLSIVDDDIVRTDMTTWMKGEARKGWLVFVGFLLTATAEVYYI